MRFQNYLTRIRESLQGDRTARRTKKRRKESRLTLLRPCLERLEDRMVLNNPIDFSQFGPFLNQALTAIQSQGITRQIDSTGLPLIGNQLNQATPPSAAQFLNPVQTSLQTAFKSVSSTTDESEFKTALGNQLQSDGLLINPVTRVGGDPTTNAVEYQFTVGVDQNHALTSSVNVDPKLGLPGLNINVGPNATAELSVWYQDTITFGVNNGTYYIDTTKNSSGTNDSFLDMHIKATIDPKASLQGSVGVLQFSAHDTGTDVEMEYTGNLNAPNNQLTQGNLSANGVEYNGTTSLNANILLRLNADFGASANTPMLQSDFVFHWTASANNPTSLTDFSTAPQTVEFDKVQMQAQSFFQGVAGPILQEIHTVTGPLKPIIDALQEEPLKQIGITFTVQQILEKGLGITQEQMSYIDAVENLVNLVNAATTDANSAGTINLGSFSLSNPISGSVGIASSDPNSNALNDLQSDAPDFSNALNAENSTPPNSPPAGLYFNFLHDPSLVFHLFVGASSASTLPPLVSFTLPTLNIAPPPITQTIPPPIVLAPLPIIITFGVQGGIDLTGHLSMGYDAQGLIDYQQHPTDPSKLLDGFYIDTANPLLKITGASSNSGNSSYFLSFSVSGTLTFDLSTFVDDLGLSLPSWASDLLDNLLPLPHAEASATLQAGLTGHVQLSLDPNDPNGQPRFRLAEPSAGPLFNPQGEIDFDGDIEFKATFKADIPTVTVEYDQLGIPDGLDIGDTPVTAPYDDVRNLAPIPLFTFGNSVSSNTNVQQPPSDPQLATWYKNAATLSDGHQVSAGTLVLNVGPNAGNRAVSPNDTSANYVINHVSGSPTAQGGETVSVQAFGATDQYSRVTAIYADTGADNDTILLGDGVLSPSYLQAGSGTDTLQAGGGATTLVGGSGTDTLIAGPTAGVKNTIITSTGNTTVQGGAGDDSITIRGSGTNNITGGSGNDTVFSSGNSNFALITDSSGNTHLVAGGTSTLNEIKSVQLSGSANSQSFTVQNWGAAVSLSGSGKGDQFNIGLVGSGSSSYTVQDSAGDGTLQVTGSTYGDDFTIKAGSVTDHAEQVTYSGIDQLIVQAGVHQQQRSNFYIEGTSTGTTTTVNGGASVNKFNVQSVGGPTIINTISGEDTIDVGSNAPAINGILTGIQGALTINGSNGFDTANVDDTGAAAIRSGTLTPTTLTGLGMGPSGITFGGLNKLNLSVGQGASAADTFNITEVNTPSLVTGPTYAFATQIPAGRLLVSGNIGSVHVDTGTPGSFAGPVATATLYEGYSPWTLQEFYTPPATFSPPPGGTLPSNNPTPPGSSDSIAGQPVNTVSAPVNVLSTPAVGVSSAAGIGAVPTAFVASAGGSPPAATPTAQPSIFTLFFDLYEMELNLFEMELSWLQTLVNLKGLPLP